MVVAQPSLLVNQDKLKEYCKNVSRSSKKIKIFKQLKEKKSPIIKRISSSIDYGTIYNDELVHKRVISVNIGKPKQTTQTNLQQLQTTLDLNFLKRRPTIPRIRS